MAVRAAGVPASDATLSASLLTLGGDLMSMLHAS